MPPKLSAILFSLFLLVIVIFIAIKIFENQKTYRPTFLKERKFIGAKPKSFASRDCQTDKIPCISDSTCLTFCNKPIYKCENYTCELTKPPESKCEPEKGGIWVLQNLDAFGKANWQCLCLYPEIFSGPACNQKNPYVCKNGFLNVNFMKSTEINSNQCNCKQPLVSVMSDTNNAFRTRIPLCVTKEEAANFFNVDHV